MSTSSKSKTESWKAIKGFEGYSVSNQGRIKNDAGDILAPYNGALIVMSVKGKPVCRSVPKLVYSAFVGPVKKGTRVHRINPEKGFALANLVAGGKS